MTINELAEGAAIIAKYEPGDHCVGAEHDVLYVGSTPPEQIGPTDRERLNELGWKWDTDLDCWRHFT